MHFSVDRIFAGRYYAAMETFILHNRDVKKHAKAGVVTGWSELANVAQSLQLQMGLFGIADSGCKLYTGCMILLLNGTGIKNREIDPKTRTQFKSAMQKIYHYFPAMPKNHSQVLELNFVESNLIEARFAAKP